MSPTLSLRNLKTALALLLLLATAGWTAVAIRDLTQAWTPTLPPAAHPAPASDPELIARMQRFQPTLRPAIQAFARVNAADIDRLDTHLRRLAADRNWFIVRSTRDSSVPLASVPNTYGLTIPHQDQDIVRRLEADPAGTLDPEADLPPPQPVPESGQVIRAHYTVLFEKPGPAIQKLIAALSAVALAIGALVLARLTPNPDRAPLIPKPALLTAVLLSASLATALGTAHFAQQLHREATTHDLPLPPEAAAPHTPTTLLMQTGNHPKDLLLPLRAQLELRSADRERYRQLLAALAAERNWQVLETESYRTTGGPMKHRLLIPPGDPTSSPPCSSTPQPSWPRTACRRRCPNPIWTGAC